MSVKLLSKDNTFIEFCVLSYLINNNNAYTYNWQKFKVVLESLKSMYMLRGKCDRVLFVSLFNST